MNYTEMTRKALLAEMKNRGESGFWKMSKEQLANALQAQDDAIASVPVKKAKVKKQDALGRATSPNYVGVGDFWAMLFDTNELNRLEGHFDRILTDEEITAALRSQYPDRPSKVFEQVPMVRGRYNRTALSCSYHTPSDTGGESHRYDRDEDGAIWLCTPRGKRIEKLGEATPLKPKAKARRRKAKG